MIDIIHRIGIRTPAAEVYRAIATAEGVAGWWTKETTGEARVGGTVNVCFRDHGVEKGRMDLEVLKLTPGKEVLWRVTAGPPEWIGTDVTFSLSQEDEYTVLLVRPPELARSRRVHGSLQYEVGDFPPQPQGLVENGEGSPAPDDLKIENWN